MPVNFLIIESLQKFHHYYGDDFKSNAPPARDSILTINEVAQRTCAGGSTQFFLRDATGRRPVFGKCKKLQADPHFNDYLLFHEYFHGDNGRGLGASHQTGWTGLVAKFLQPRRELLGSCPRNDVVNSAREDSYQVSNAQSRIIVPGNSSPSTPGRG